MINRPMYLEQLIKVRDMDVIKVLTGVRRCGKSTILKMLRNTLLDEGIEEDQIQMINFEDMDNIALYNYELLHKHVLNHLVPNKKNYILLDEIQVVEHFERAINSLFLRDNIDLYVTGSNAYMLSGELATLLSGRYIEIPVFPLSFSEFYSTCSGLSKTEAFNEYIDRGGFPHAVVLEDESTHNIYIDSIINSVLIKDITDRRQLSNSRLIKQIASYLLESSGSLVSIKQIVDTLTAMGIKTSHGAVDEYVLALLEAFLFYRCDRIDIKTRSLFQQNPKFYPVDQSFRMVLLGRQETDLEHRLKGIVYMELLRRGYKVYGGHLRDGRIDFLATKAGVTTYYQVAATIQDERTYARKLTPLLSIDDNYEKFILTMDSGTYNDQGIQILNAADWLLDL